MYLKSLLALPHGSAGISHALKNDTSLQAEQNFLKNFMLKISAYSSG